MVRLADLEACIVVDHVLLPEYAVSRNEAAKTITCWVPSTAQKAFEVSWRNTAPFASIIAGYLRVDGTPCKGETPINRRVCEERVHSQVFTTATFMRPLKFCSVGATDPIGDCCSKKVCTSGIGDIVLHIWEVIPLEAHTPHEFQLPKPRICDRLRNEVTHYVALGESIYVGVKTVLKCSPVQRFATFIFKYRSWDTLKAMGIVSDCRPERQLEAAAVLALLTSRRENPVLASKKRKPDDEPLPRVTGSPSESTIKQPVKRLPEKNRANDNVLSIGNSDDDQSMKAAQSRAKRRYDSEVSSEGAPFEKRIKIEGSS